MAKPINFSSSARTDREIIERNRRNNEIKELLSTLNSLVSNQLTSKEGEMVPDDVVLENATDYIKHMQEKLEKLKEKKDKLKGMKKCNKEMKQKLSVLNVEARQVDYLIEILLTTGFDDHFVLPQIIKLIHENGADVLNVNQFKLTGRLFHVIIAHQVVGEGMASRGSDFERIRETMKKFISQYKDGQYNV